MYISTYVCIYLHTYNPACSSTCREHQQPKYILQIVAHTHTHTYTYANVCTHIHMYIHIYVFNPFSIFYSQLLRPRSPHVFGLKKLKQLPLCCKFHRCDVLVARCCGCCTCKTYVFVLKHWLSVGSIRSPVASTEDLLTIGGDINRRFVWLPAIIDWIIDSMWDRGEAVVGEASWGLRALGEMLKF